MNPQNIIKTATATARRPRGRPHGLYNTPYNRKAGSRRPGRPSIELTEEIIADRLARRRISVKKYTTRIRKEKKEARQKIKAEKEAQKEAEKQAQKAEREKIKAEKEAQKAEKEAEKEAQKAEKQAQREAEKEKRLQARLAMNLRKKAVARELKENPELVNLLWELTQKHKGGQIEIKLRDGSILTNIKFSNKPNPKVKNEDQINKEISADITELTKLEI